jgi:CRISPR-associated protein Cas2
MRLVLFFDLPSVTDSQKKEYLHFVKNIKKIGFYMLQESVYVKMDMDDRAAMSSIQQVRGILPPDGMVAVLKVTEKQFASTYYLLGDPVTDVINNDDRTIIL